MLSHSLRNFEIQNNYHNELKYNGVYSRNNLPKTKDGTYVINIDEYKWIGTHWIRLYVNNINVTYFDSFGAKHIPKEMKKIIKKTIITNFYKMQIYGFIDFTLKCISLLDYANYFSANDY